MNNGSRSYVMRARADATAQTRERILLAVMALAEDRPLEKVVLADVAAAAEVSVQTVLRHFGSRDELFDAAIAHGAELIAAERVPPTGDIPGALGVLYDHYELRGTAMLMLLAQETWDARARAITDSGRTLHREWVADVFAAQLRDRADREEVLDLLVVATDLYTWKLLRLDRLLARPVAQSRVQRMLDSLLEG